MKPLIRDGKVQFSLSEADRKKIGDVKAMLVLIEQQNLPGDISEHGITHYIDQLLELV